MSEDLKLDDEQLTPAQAYSAIRETVPSDEYLRPVLEELKNPLGSLVHCLGFGAVMDAVSVAALLPLFPMLTMHAGHVLATRRWSDPDVDIHEARVDIHEARVGITYLSARGAKYS